VPKNAEILPDTNVLLRYLLRDDAVQYAKAEVFFEDVRIGREKAVIMESVLVECMYILMKFYKVPRGETADILTALLQYKGIANPDRKMLIEALRIFAEQNLDIVDCILLTRAKQGKGRLFSFDKALNKLHESMDSD
jgi:predicted nucleic-acid-binding protein